MIDNLKSFSNNSGKKDFSKCDEINLVLNGAMDKTSVVYNNEIYILKFEKGNSKFILSEYLVSKLANLLGIECQEVLLGMYKGRDCCVIKSLIGFSNMKSKIHCYKEINNSSIESDSTYIRNLDYKLDDILETLKSYKNLNISVEDRLKAFEEMCYFDSLIGNFDRHWGNWGFLGTNKDYKICPLYDNGSSLFPTRDRFGVDKILSSEEEMLFRTYNIPTSQIKNTNNKKYIYSDLIKDLTSIFGISELKKFNSKFKKLDLKKLIFEDDMLDLYCSEIDKEFYYKILRLRFSLLLEGVI